MCIMLRFSEEINQKLDFSNVYLESCYTSTFSALNKSTIRAIGKEKKLKRNYITPTKILKAVEPIVLTKLA